MAANVTYSNLATEDFKQETALYYPNPTKTIININLRNTTNLDKVKVIEITKSNNANTKSNKIYVVDFASGIYIIEVKTGDKKFQSKFVKNSLVFLVVRRKQFYF